MRERRAELTELDSQILGRETVEFLSPNNTLILAHQGSAVTLSCRLNKTPYFGMVMCLLHLILNPGPAFLKYKMCIERLTIDCVVGDLVKTPEGRELSSDFVYWRLCSHQRPEIPDREEAPGQRE